MSVPCWTTLKTLSAFSFHKSNDKVYGNIRSRMPMKIYKSIYILYFNMENY